MATKAVNLKLKDMYAIKHALQNSVRQKNKRLEYLCTEEYVNFDGEVEKEIDTLDKDLTHEEALVKKFEAEIKNFKAKYKIR